MFVFPDFLREEGIELAANKVLAKRERKRKVPEQRGKELWEIPEYQEQMTRAAAAKLSASPRIREESASVPTTPSKLGFNIKLVRTYYRSMKTA